MNVRFQGITYLTGPAHKVTEEVNKRHKQLQQQNEAGKDRLVLSSVYVDYPPLPEEVETFLQEAEERMEELGLDSSYLADAEDEYRSEQLKQRPDTPATGVILTGPDVKNYFRRAGEPLEPTTKNLLYSTGDEVDFSQVLEEENEDALERLHSKVNAVIASFSAHEFAQRLVGYAQDQIVDEFSGQLNDKPAKRATPIKVLGYNANTKKFAL